MAEAARTESDLVVMTYSARTIPKEAGTPAPLLPEAVRIEALARFCAPRPWTAVGLCSHGLLVDQVAAAGDRFPAARILLVMGSDKLIQLLDPRWYPDPEMALGRLFGRAEVLFAVRAGDDEAVGGVLAPVSARWPGGLRRLAVSPEVAAASSRLVRERLRRGEGVEGLIPPEVVEFLSRT